MYSRIRKLRGKIHPMYLVIAHNYESCNLVMRYFCTFPLRSSKAMDFHDWAYVIALPKPLNEQNKKRIILMRSNKTRTTFNWDHLKHWPIHSTDGDPVGVAVKNNQKIAG